MNRNNKKVENVLNSQMTLFLVSTHYEGNPCDAGKTFYTWIKNVAEFKEDSR